MASVVQDIMDALGVGQRKDLAVMLKVSPSAISHYERRGLSRDALQKIARLARERQIELPDSFYGGVTPTPQSKQDVAA